MTVQGWEIYGIKIEEIVEHLQKYHKVNFNDRRRREKKYSIMGNNKLDIINCLVSNEKIVEERMKERQKNMGVRRFDQGQYASAVVGHRQYSCRRDS